MNGTELYEIAVDPEQRNDVSAEHPDVVEQLRAEYEKWWDVVSEKFDDEQFGRLRKTLADRAEKTDLAAAKPQIVAAMTKTLMAWKKSCDRSRAGKDDAK